MIAARLAASPDRHARLAALALLGLVLVLLLGAFLAWSTLDGQGERIEEARFELDALARRVKARAPGIARAERALAADPFLPGATPTLAANALQRRIVGVAEATGVRLRTIAAEPAAEIAPDALPQVVLQASASARIAALQTFLYRLETEAPFILVDDVSLRAPSSSTNRGAAAADPELEIELRLIGYLRRKEG